MAVIVTATFGLCLWIILWSLQVSGLDAILIACGLVFIVTGLRNLAPLLTGRKDR